MFAGDRPPRYGALDAALVRETSGCDQAIATYRGRK